MGIEFNFFCVCVCVCVCVYVFVCVVHLVIEIAFVLNRTASSQCGTLDAVSEIKIPSVENPELLKVLPLLSLQEVRVQSYMLDLLP